MARLRDYASKGSDESSLRLDTRALFRNLVGSSEETLVFKTEAFPAPVLGSSLQRGPDKPIGTVCAKRTRSR